MMLMQTVDDWKDLRRMYFLILQVWDVTSITFAFTFGVFAVMLYSGTPSDETVSMPEVIINIFVTSGIVMLAIWIGCVAILSVFQLKIRTCVTCRHPFQKHYDKKGNPLRECTYSKKCHCDKFVRKSYS